MRFIYILIVSFLLSTSVCGQKTFTSRAGDNYWYYRFSGKDISSFNTSESISRDSFFINGKYYRKFVSVHGQLLFYLRDEDRKTYVFSDIGRPEVIVFDFNLNVGDTMKSVYDGRKFDVIIGEKTKIKIEDDSLIQFKCKIAKDGVNWTFNEYYFVESIGGYNVLNRPLDIHPIFWYGLFFSSGESGHYFNCLMHGPVNLLTSLGRGNGCEIQHDLLNTNKKWYTWASNNNGDLKFSVPYYFTNRDTTLFGKKYRTMNQINRFVRYDSLASKYFILSNYNNGQELLVYSDKVKIGDTMAIYGTISDTITKIEYKWIEDEYRKVITTGRDVYISGIGSVNRVMWNNHLATFPEFASGNICYEENGTIRYHYPFFYQNKEQCEITSSIQNASIRSISFFPNPVKTSLNFNTSDTKEFKIRNSLGVLVLEGECEEKIDLATLPKGIYFIELQAKNRTSHTKFLKE